MAFADYFAKNLQAASLLLQGIDSDAFKSVLAQEVVGLAFDENAVKTSEGQATLDLAIRLIARLYPTVSVVPIGDAAKRAAKNLERLAIAVNPKIDLRTGAKGLTKCLTVGTSNPKLPAKAKPFIVYVGSDNWLSSVSTKAPRGSGNTRNVFGAGAAACVGVANVFRATFAKNLPAAKADEDVSFSILDMAPSKKRPKNPSWTEVDLGELHLIGAGAIGNGFLWALRESKCRGELHIVDGEPMELSNLQRYAMTLSGDDGKGKAELAKAWLSISKLSVHAHPQHWEDYLPLRNNWYFERVAVAVDNARTRINVQAALPRTVFNSWTQLGEVGLSRHGFLGKGACLACLYMPEKQTVNLDQLILCALRLPDTEQQLMEIRRRLDLSVTTDLGFLQHVSTTALIPIEQLLPFEGKLLQDLYVRGICGGAIMERAASNKIDRAEVPMAFQSTLAGILLIADIFAEAAGLRQRLPTMTQINLLTALPQIPSSGQKKADGTRCFCVDQDFIDVYQAKYLSNSGRGEGSHVGVEPSADDRHERSE